MIDDAQGLEDWPAVAVGFVGCHAVSDSMQPLQIESGWSGLGRGWFDLDIEKGWGLVFSDGFFLAAASLVLLCGCV